MDLDDVEIVSSVIPVILDIKPGSEENPVNLKSKGTLPVAVLSDSDFDATTINPDLLNESLVFAI